MKVEIYRRNGKFFYLFNIEEIKKCFTEKNYNTFAEFIEITSSFAANRCCDFIPDISDFKKIADEAPNDSSLIFCIKNGEFVYIIITTDGYTKTITPAPQMSGMEKKFEEIYDNKIKLLEKYFPNTYDGF